MEDCGRVLYMRQRFTNGRFEALALVMAVLAASCGCQEDAALRGAAPHKVTVGTVTDQDLVLDADATPKQVTFALCRAIRDDVLAGQDQAAREAALERQLNLCAPAYILEHYRGFFRGYPVDGAASVHKVVRSWAPMLARYVDSLGMDRQTAQTRMREGPTASQDPDKTRTNVFFEVADPSGRREANVVVRVYLVREEGFWRVGHVGFVHERRHLSPRRTKDVTKDSKDT
jgi:hypothetical protein